MKVIKFPQDFERREHYLSTPDDESWQWIYAIGSGDKNEISIVGGGRGLYGDGYSTFEMWDRIEDEPRGYMTREEINKYLEEHPIEEEKELEDKSDYIGDDIYAAEWLANSRGLQTRIVSRDGNPLMLTSDFKPDRLNFTVVDNIVTKVGFG